MFVRETPQFLLECREALLQFGVSAQFMRASAAESGQTSGIARKLICVLVDSA